MLKQAYDAKVLIDTAQNSTSASANAIDTDTNVDGDELSASDGK